MSETKAITPRPKSDIHAAVLSATVAISVEIFTCLFGLVWSLGRMLFNLSNTAASFEAAGIGVATVILAVLMARMFYRHELQNDPENAA
jgi:hypothetical protein